MLFHKKNSCNDKFIVSWDRDEEFVFGQIFNANGTKTGSEFQISFVTISQRNPSVSSLSNDKFVVTWGSDGQDGDGFGIYGQIFDAYGRKTGPEFLVNTYTIGNQEESSVASLSNGTFVVTWQSNAQDGSGIGIYGQLFGTDITGISSSTSSFGIGTSKSNTAVVSGAERQTTSIALTALSWIISTFKGALGY